MDKAKLDRLQGLIEAGFANLWDAITLAMDINEGEPGATPPGWPPLTEVVERLDYSNRILSGLIKQLPRRAPAAVAARADDAGVLAPPTHR